MVKRVTWLAAFCFIAGTGGVPAMTMRVAGDQAILSGRLEPSDEAQFSQVLQSNPSISTVVLWNSPGGSAAANADLTAMIQDRKLDTAVAGYCVSACAMVFLSGSQRYFSDGESLDRTSLGFHGSYLHGTLAGEKRLQFLENLVETETEGKTDPSLVEHWLHLADESQTVRFRYPGSDGTPKTATVFNCQGGGGPNRGDYDSCTPIAGPNALSMGIITSTRIVHVER
ncbi:MAG: hypothetical protein WB615_08370 [Candidatus Tumulicola sp.]